MKTTLPSKHDLFDLIVRRTLRVPMPPVTVGGAYTAADTTRQLDSLLMDVGFKLSGEAMNVLSSLDAGIVEEYGKRVLAVIQKMLGNHRNHNTLFRGFPDKIPSTTAYWFMRLSHALRASKRSDMAEAMYVVTLSDGTEIDLLKGDLTYYGRYAHTYEEMVREHSRFRHLLKGAFKVLVLGEHLDVEVESLFRSLAGSTVPLSEDDMVTLGVLCDVCTNVSLESVPVREIKALVNTSRVNAGASIVADTPTDILRLAAGLCLGDVTLEKPTKFRKLSRPVRRSLMKALDVVISFGHYRLGDVLRHQEMWKRLGERLHPHEFKNLPLARDVFAVARGETDVKTLAGRAEVAFAAGDLILAINTLRVAPGMLFRSIDRLIVAMGEDNEKAIYGLFFDAVREGMPKVSGRVLLSLREHLMNRADPSPTGKRIFAVRSGKAYVVDEKRKPLYDSLVLELVELLDEEISRRLPVMSNLTVDVLARGVGVPISEKNKVEGLGVLQRGSTVPVTGDIIRFFHYWKQTGRCTDHDLSLILMDSMFNPIEHVAWNNLTSRDNTIVHSGDVRDASYGASEFINVNLSRVRKDCWYLVPQVNVWGGENFEEVEECFGGFMEMASTDKGLPFEPKAVRAKSALKGKGKIALPIFFARTPDGGWEGKWMHLYSQGDPQFNRVETNKVSTGLLARAIFGRKYLTIGYLADMLLKKAVKDPTLPKTYIGLGAPQENAESTKVYSPLNFHELIPA